MNKYELWFNKEAGDWMQALPLGNGKMGAMVYGGCDVEKVYLNEDAFYAGTVVTDDNAPYENVEKMRELILSGKQPEAEWIVENKMSGPNNMAYQPLSYVYLDFGHKNIEGYRRSLDIENAVTGVEYTCDGVKYTREAFISMNKDLMVYKISADKAGALSFSVSMDCPIMHFTYNKEDHLVTLTKCPDLSWPECVYTDYEGITGVTIVKIKTDGEVSYRDSKAYVSGATEAEVYIAAATSYVDFDKKPDADALGICSGIIAEFPEYDAFKAEHIVEYRKYFDRMEFDLGEALPIPTNERIVNIEKNNDTDLVSLYFNFGRYLQITSSAPGSHASNLQGIWNDLKNPPWQCTYTLNINVEMNYWMAELCNLSECHLALFDLVRSFAKNGKVSARQYYDCGGWCACHNIDLWAKTAPFTDCEQSARWGMWNMPGPWLCLHMFEHFRYTNDLDFIKDNYEIFEGVAEFLGDWMFIHEGRYITCPSTSPENRFLNEEGKLTALSYSTTMDIALITEFFREFIKISEMLGKNTKFVDKAKEILSNMHGYQIGADGCLMEWIKDYEQTEPGHRHVSHLLGVYPGNTITPEETPDVFEAAKKSLDFRVANGSGYTGWSSAWIANLYASFFDGEKAGEFINRLIGTSTHPNMFNSDPSIDPSPFQIDGNFGGTVAIARMIMQNAYGKIRILPALPPEWKCGKMTGLRAEGGFTVDVYWNDNKLDYAKIAADWDNVCRVVGEYSVECDGMAIDVKFENGITEFSAEAGKSYVLR